MNQQKRKTDKHNKSVHNKRKFYYVSFLSLKFNMELLIKSVPNFTFLIV